MSSEKGSSSLNLEKCSLVLLDVAGTTTSINFVKDTLFPFAVRELESFLKAKWDEEAVKSCIEQIKEGGDALDVAAAVERVKTLTKEDSSNKGLKSLQGLIYKQGYESGDLKAHVFEDVPNALESWAKNHRIAVYSTGSVDSQKLLFAHTASGDLTAHISKFFDQEAGPKTESESYKKIAQEMEVTPEEIVFVTDDASEAIAAKSSGVVAVLIKRDGNAPLSEDTSKEFTVISSFKDLGLEKTTKRKIEEETVAAEEPPSKVPKTNNVEKSEEPKTNNVEKSEEPKTSEENKEKTEQMEVDSTDEKPTETVTQETEESTTTSEKTEAEVKDETKTTETTEKDSEVKMETTTSVQKSDDKVEADSKVEEKKKESGAEEKAAEEEKVEKDEAKPVAEEEKTVSDDAESVKEVKPTEVEQTNGDDKPEKEQTPAEDPKEVSDGTVESAVDGESSANKTDEKENESLLANNVENGKVNNEVESGTESAPLTTDEIDKDEVKVKKLEESAESKAVSVEV